MANPTATAIDIFQTLAAFDAQFDEEFVRLKIDPPGKEVSRDQIFKRDGEILGNLQDDAIRRLVKSIPRRSFDNRQSIASALREPPAAPVIATASIPNAGGTGDFTIDARIADGQVLAIRVVSVSGLSALIDIELFVDAARLLSAYRALAVDPSTAFVDGTPFALMHIGPPGSPGDLAPLEARTVYGRITNNGAAASLFEIEAVIEGI